MAWDDYYERADTIIQNPAASHPSEFKSEPNLFIIRLGLISWLLMTRFRCGVAFAFLREVDMICTRALRAALTMS